MAKKIKSQTPPSGKALTREERAKLDESIWTDEDSAYEITRDGKRYRVGPKGNLIPINGSQAQAALKKKKAPKAKP